MKLKRITELRRALEKGLVYPHMVEECLNEIEALREIFYTYADHTQECRLVTSKPSQCVCKFIETRDALEE